MNYEHFDVKYLERFTCFEGDTLDILNSSITNSRTLRIFYTCGKFYQILFYSNPKKHLNTLII